MYLPKKNEQATEKFIAKENKLLTQVFSRLLVLSSRNIDLKYIIGKYVLFPYPRALFHSDGSLVGGSNDKSSSLNLIHFLKSTLNFGNKKITILDGMYMLRKFEDKYPLKTMKDMANSFAINIQKELENMTN